MAKKIKIPLNPIAAFLSVVVGIASTWVIQRNMQRARRELESRRTTPNGTEGTGAEDDSFTWTLQGPESARNSGPKRDGAIVRSGGAPALTFTGRDNKPRSIPLDLAYVPPTMSDPPLGLKVLPSALPEVAWVTRALWGYFLSRSPRLPVGTTVPFRVDGQLYAARLEPHDNAPVGLSVYVATDAFQGASV